MMRNYPVKFIQLYFRYRIPNSRLNTRDFRLETSSSRFQIQRAQTTLERVDEAHNEYSAENQKYLEMMKKSLRPIKTNTQNELKHSASPVGFKLLPWMKKLDLGFPHFFKEQINWELVDVLADETCAWAERVFQSTGSKSKDCYKFFSDYKSDARDIALMPFLCAPESWDGKTEVGFSKHLLWAKIFACQFIHDDMMEGQVGKAGFFKFIQVNAQVLYKIFSLQYENVEGVTEDVLAGLKGLGEDFGQLAPTIIIWYEIATELHEKFGITREQMEALAKTKRGETSYIAWCGADDQSFFSNLSMRRLCRVNSIQHNSVAEFLMLIEGCFPTPALREDIHYIRFRRMACEMVALVNDLISAAKEMATESFPDNLVFLYMNNNGMSLSDSYKKVVQKQNEKISEFQQLYHYMRSDSFSTLDQLNLNQPEPEGENQKDKDASNLTSGSDFASVSTVVDLQALLVGSFFQSHFMMERYRRHFTENLE